MWRCELCSQPTDKRYHGDNTECLCRSCYFSQFEPENPIEDALFVTLFYDGVNVLRMKLPVAERCCDPEE